MGVLCDSESISLLFYPESGTLTANKQTTPANKLSTIRMVKIRDQK